MGMKIEPPRKKTPKLYSAGIKSELSTRAWRVINEKKVKKRQIKRHSWEWLALDQVFVYVCLWNFWNYINNTPGSNWPWNIYCWITGELKCSPNFLTFSPFQVSSFCFRGFRNSSQFEIADGCRCFFFSVFVSLCVCVCVCAISPRSVPRWGRVLADSL